MYVSEKVRVVSRVWAWGKAGSRVPLYVGVSLILYVLGVCGESVWDVNSGCGFIVGFIVVIGYWYVIWVGIVSSYNGGEYILVCGGSLCEVGVEGE